MKIIAIVLNRFRAWCGVAVVFSALLANQALAKTYSVKNAIDFNALPLLNAGDLVILESGSYKALTKTLESTISSDSVAKTNPILVYAKVAGGVRVTEPSEITLKGRGITLSGLDFSSGSGMRNNGKSDPAWIIHLNANSRLMKLSNLRFKNCTAGDDYGHWIFAEGFDHLIEYCSFEGKNEPNRNATVAFKRSTDEAGGIDLPRNHVIRYCYFGPRESSNLSGDAGNGYETIRIGDSSSQAHLMKVTVEHNVFYRSIWRTDGKKPQDMEIISNKSRGNIIRQNTFLESYGQITLRHGDNAIVDGNFTFGAGYYSGNSILLRTPNSYQGGVRIIGQNHTISNNYFINLAGEELRAALSLLGGESSFKDGNGSGGSSGYEASHGAKIFNNTFLNCHEMNLGLLQKGSVEPTSVKIYNNVWQGSGTSHGIVRNSLFTPSGSGGNYIYHPLKSYGWTGLKDGVYSGTASPLVTEVFDRYLIPTAASPLLGKANSSLVSDHDVTGLKRPASAQDIGCFERGLSGTGYRPLLRNEVGPIFDGGPTGAYFEQESRLVVAASAVTASANDGHLPAATVDGSLLDNDRWSAFGEGAWINYNLGAEKNVRSIKIAWYKGNQRISYFDVQTSLDGVTWKPILSQHQSSGSSLALEPYDFPDTRARQIRIVGYGNSVSEWNSITEVEIYGTD